MEYYNILNFKKEPFSNSPEPEFFFQSPQYTGCLQNLELAVRLRRGLNVVIGDIGTGKTTLCRKLIQRFSSTEEDIQLIETHLLLDPAFNDTFEFLQTVAAIIGIKDLDNKDSEWHLKEKIKNYLFTKGVNEGKVIVLIIDEGQKIPENCLEILREFLNYETNNFKLLQIIIFAQEEFKTMLKKRANLSDRVNLLYYLKPFDFKQMRAMIDYRLSVAGNFETVPQLFSYWGLVAIYLATSGYPRKVVSLCHKVILMMIIRRKRKAGFLLIKSCISGESFAPLFRKLKWAALSFLIIISLGIFALSMYSLRQNAGAYKQILLSEIVTKPGIEASTQSNLSNSQDNKDHVDNSNLQSEVYDQGKDKTTQSYSYTTIPRETEDVVNKGKRMNAVWYKMPDYLGTLTLKKGRTLWWMLQNVYGDAGSEITQAVIKANPQVKNINLITEGKILNLPSIPANINPIKEGDIIVLIEEGKDMEAVYGFFRKNLYQQSMPPLVFFPFWNKKEEGITFAVIIDKCFNNNQAVREAISKLPNEIAAKTKIVSQWKENTIFFNRQILKR